MDDNFPLALYGPTPVTGKQIRNAMIHQFRQIQPNPQDLRDRAGTLLKESYGTMFAYPKSMLLNVAVSLASEVSAEKEEELNRWRNAHHKITTQDVELRETIYHLQNRNAKLEARVKELEKELAEWKDAAFAKIVKQ